MVTVSDRGYGGDGSVVKGNKDSSGHGSKVGGRAEIVDVVEVERRL